MRGVYLSGRSLDRLRYLHRKRRCEMLIGGDDNDLSSGFQCFLFNIRARFRFELIDGKLTAQSTKS